jgi:uncharacterized membrane protein
MEEAKNVERRVYRLKGQLYESFIIRDDVGNEVQRVNLPLKVELKIRDVLEIVVGSCILAVPIAFTEEVWDLGESLEWGNIIVLSCVSLFFLGSFIYFAAYRRHIKLYRYEYLKRVFTTWVLSVIIVGLLLTIVNESPWISDFDLALKRTLIGAFPASMSATVTDNAI